MENLDLRSYARSFVFSGTNIMPQVQRISNEGAANAGDGEVKMKSGPTEQQAFKEAQEHLQGEKHLQRYRLQDGTSLGEKLFDNTGTDKPSNKKS